MSNNKNYGDWKSLEDIGLSDLMRHNIWVWCSLLPNEEDGPIDGDETSMRPLLESTNVTCQQKTPLILMKIDETEYFASGVLSVDTRKVTAISVYDKGRFVRKPELLPAMPKHPVLVAVPDIGGQKNLRFRWIDDEASSE